MRAEEPQSGRLERTLMRGRRIPCPMCDVAEEEFAELLAWREAVARVDPPTSVGPTADPISELRRRVPGGEGAPASA